MPRLWLMPGSVLGRFSPLTFPPDALAGCLLGPSVERFHQSTGMPIAEIYDLLRKAQPIQRLGTPQEIGNAVLFLLSDDCPFMTGALVCADGGYTSQESV